MCSYRLLIYVTILKIRYKLNTWSELYCLYCSTFEHVYKWAKKFEWFWIFILYTCFSSLTVPTTVSLHCGRWLIHHGAQWNYWEPRQRLSWERLMLLAGNTSLAVSRRMTNKRTQSQKPLLNEHEQFPLPTIFAARLIQNHYPLLLKQEFIDQKDSASVD